MPISLDRVQAICFDLDGTLSDTDDVIVRRLVRVLKPVARWLPGRDPAALARSWVMHFDLIGNTAVQVIDTLHIDRVLAAATRPVRRRLPHKPGGYLVIPGVLPVLEALSARYPLALISANSAGASLAFLAQFQLKDTFRVVATSQTAPHTKPHPDPLFWTARQLEVPPEACLMVGDTPVDIEMARRAGAQSIGVLCGFGSHDELERAGADLILPSTADLAGLFVPSGTAST